MFIVQVAPYGRHRQPGQANERHNLDWVDDDGQLGAQKRRPRGLEDEEKKRLTGRELDEEKDSIDRQKNLDLALL